MAMCMRMCMCKPHLMQLAARVEDARINATKSEPDLRRIRLELLQFTPKSSHSHPVTPSQAEPSRFHF